MKARRENYPARPLARTGAGAGCSCSYRCDDGLCAGGNGYGNVVSCAETVLDENGLKLQQWLAMAISETGYQLDLRT